MRDRKLMNRGWKFYFGEPAYLRTRAESSDQTYRGTRAANARGPARRDYDDRSWETVQLPHDFVALNGVSETDAHGGEHFDFPMDRGSAWYRRYFTLDEADREKRIVLHFEGMGTFCEVYVNSMLMKTNRTNGIGFDVDITDVVRFGDEQNVVAVHCDCHDFEAWYYEGGGITRDVWLQKTDRVSVDLWGTFVRSIRGTGKDWTLLIDTEVRNDYNEDKDVRVLSVILDGKGQKVAEAYSEPQCISKRSITAFRQSVTLTDPALWSPESPALYTLKTQVELADSCETEAFAAVDDYRTTFGIRELLYDKDHGLSVNGKQTTIYGFANHMLYLGVGEAMTDSMCEYQIRTLRDMGSNGYRTAHSPHQEKIMDWCDRYGQLVMDENRIFHTSDIVIDELKRLIKRDRNHPSVCMWSVYNEEDFVTNENGRRMFRTLKEEILKLDPTRPVSGATSYGMFSEGAHEDYDLFGFNHQTMNLDALHHMKPDKPIYCSEMIIPLGRQRDFAGLCVRTGEDARQVQKEFMIGGFHFTAWGYGPERPEILGMEGTPGPAFYGFKAYLKPDVPFAKIWPGWDFPGQEGQAVSLNLANNGDHVEIYVNGKLLERIETDPYAITPYTLSYEPGELKIIAYKDGKPWTEDTARTPGAPAKLVLVCENSPAETDTTGDPQWTKGQLLLQADGTDTAIISAYVTDADGNPCLHDTGRLIRFSWNDAGELVTTLSLRDDLFQGYVGPEIRNFDGKCQALIRSKETGCEDCHDAAPAPIIVCAKAEGLEAAELVIPRKKAEVRQVPETPCGYINDWHMSKCCPGEMEDEKVMREHSTERWPLVDTVGTQVLSMPGGKAVPAGTPLNYAYYTKTVIPELRLAVQKGDARGEATADSGTEQEILALRFEGIDGKANIYITDGKKTAVGHHPGDSPWFGHYRPELIVPCAEFKPGDEVEIWVMMHDIGRVHGIGWPVHWLYTTCEKIRELEEQTAREWSYYRFRYPDDQCGE